MKKKKKKPEENLLQKQRVQSNTIQNKVHFISENLSMYHFYLSIYGHREFK